MVEQRQSAMQRIQVGLIGLVVVLLFVSLATMVLERVADVPTGAGTVSTSVIVEEPDKAGVPDEPLAELGVTPVANEGSATKGMPSASGNQGQTAAGSSR